MNGGMKIIRPTEVTDAMIVNTSLTELDQPQWAAGTTYAKDALVMVLSTHRIYKSAQAGNLGHNPVGDDGTWWLEVKPTNRWSMFDRRVNTLATATTSLTMEISPGLIDSLALLQVDAATVLVEQIRGGQTLYSKTVQMVRPRGINSFYGYFYEPFQVRSTVILTDIPPVLGATIKVTLTRAGGNVSLGMMIPGRKKIIGSIEWGFGLSIKNYSKTSEDAFGYIDLLKGEIRDLINVSCVFDSALVDSVKPTLKEYASTPIVYVGVEGMLDSLIGYGFFQDFNINVKFLNLSYCTMRIETML